MYVLLIVTDQNKCPDAFQSMILNAMDESIICHHSYFKLLSDFQTMKFLNKQMLNFLATICQ